MCGCAAPVWGCPLLPTMSLCSSCVLTGRHSMFRLKLSIPDVCLKIILIIFLLSLSKWFDHSRGWSSSFILHCSQTILTEKAKKYHASVQKKFLFPYFESQMQIFDTWGMFFLPQMCTLLSLKKTHTALPGLCSSQILCWFSKWTFGSRAGPGCRPPMDAGPACGAQSTGPALRPPQATGVWHPGTGNSWICLWEGKEINTHGAGQGLAKKAESIFGDQNKKWVRKRKIGAVKTTGTKKEAMDGVGKGKLWSEMNGKQKCPLGLSLRKMDKTPEGLWQKKDVSIQEEASGKEGDTWIAQKKDKWENWVPESWRWGNTGQVLGVEQGMERGRKSSDRWGINAHGGEKGFMCSEEDGIFEGLGKSNCNGNAGSQQLVHKLFNIHAFNQGIWRGKRENLNT